MRLCNVQLQPQRAPSLGLPQVKRLMRRVARLAGGALHTAVGYDRGTYVNFTFETEDPSKLWQTIQAEALADREAGRSIAAASIITCQGSSGWDNYLLLHHYDRRVKVDEADEL